MFNFGEVDLSPNDGYSSLMLLLCQKVKVLVFHNRCLLCWNSVQSHATKNKRTSKVPESIMVKQLLEMDGWLSYCSYLVRIYWLEWRGIGVLANDRPWFWTRWFGIRALHWGDFCRVQKPPIRTTFLFASRCEGNCTSSTWFAYISILCKCICANYVHLYIFTNRVYAFWCKYTSSNFGMDSWLMVPLPTFQTHWSLLVPPLKKKKKPETVDPSSSTCQTHDIPNLSANPRLDPFHLPSLPPAALPTT